MAAGLAVTLGFVFSLRSGAVTFAVAALLLWRGLSPRTMILSAGALLLVVVPVLYVALPPEDQGGYSFQYAVDRIAAHWVGLAAIELLLVALLVTLVRAVRGRPASPG
jgi:hypothetical protein